MAPRSRRSSNTSYANVDYSDITTFAREIARTPADIARAENAFYSASVEAIITMAKAEAALEGALPSKAAQDMRASGRNAIIYGGKGYSRGAEFGSYRYKQFKIWRGNSDEAGYFLWPSIREYRDKAFTEQWDAHIWSVVLKDFAR